MATFPRSAVFGAAADALVRDRLLLQADADDIVREAEASSVRR